MKIITAIISFLILLYFACEAQGATKYCDLSLSADGAGTSGDPWQWSQAINAANVSAGSTVNLKGTKAAFAAITATNAKGTAGSVVTYQQWDGQTAAVFPYMTFTGPADFYITLSGFQVTLPDDGQQRKGILLTNCHHVTVQNITGDGVWHDVHTDGMTNALVYVEGNPGTAGSIVVDGCEFTDCYNCIYFAHTIDEPVTVSACELHRMSGMGVQWDPTAGPAQLTVQDCNIYDGRTAYTQYPADISHSSHRSGIALWKDNVLIQRCIFHDTGNTNLIRCYDNIAPAGGFSNVTVQNCLFYDGQNACALNFRQMHDLTFKHNTVVGIQRGGWAGADWGRYNGTFEYTLAAGAAASDIHIQGNVFPGEFVSSASNIIDEDYNFFYAWNYGYPTYTRRRTPIGANSKIICWNEGGAGTLAGYTNTFFETTGTFFAGGSLFDSLTGRWVNAATGATHGQDLTVCYKLAAASEGLGFATGMTTPTDDITANSRDANHDVGCYETYDAGEPPPDPPVDPPVEPPAPVLPSKANTPSPAHAAVDRSRYSTTLSWTAGANATGHQVYFGTDATPDSTEFKVTQTTATYNPGTLAWGKTYYWRIDEQNAAGTTTGDTWSFTTNAKPRKKFVGILAWLASLFGGGK
jgi:hypothetical protein